MKDENKDSNYGNMKTPGGRQLSEGKLTFSNLDADLITLLKNRGSISMGKLLSGLMYAMIKSGFNNAEDSEMNIRVDQLSVQKNEMAVSLTTKAYFASQVDDSMDFQTAFGTARSEMGSGAFFSWKGRMYNTYYKEEWDSLTEAEQIEFYNPIVKNTDLDSLKISDTIESQIQGEPNLDMVDESDIVSPVKDLGDIDKDEIPEALGQDEDAGDASDVIIADLDYEGLNVNNYLDWDQEQNLDVVVIDENLTVISDKVEINIDVTFNMDDFIEIASDDPDVPLKKQDEKIITESLENDDPDEGENDIEDLEDTLL